MCSGIRRTVWPLVSVSIATLCAVCSLRADWNPERWVPEPAGEIDMDELIEASSVARVDLNRAGRSTLDALDLFSPEEIGVILAGRPWKSVEGMADKLRLDAAREDVARAVLYVREARAERYTRVETRARSSQNARWPIDLRLVQRVRGRISPAAEYAFVREKDPGETSFADHCAGHLEVRRSGTLRQVILGDYVVRTGQGMLFWPDGPKGLALSRMERRNPGARGFCGTAETGFLRGALAECTLGSWTFTGFASRRRLDARLDEDGRVTGFPVTGEHRTAKEIAERHRAREELVGARVSRQRGDNALGLTWMAISYSPTVVLGDRDRDGVRFAGRILRHLSADWVLRAGPRAIFGEILLHGDPSFVAGIRETHAFLEWVLWVRNLAPFLHSPYGSLAVVPRSGMRNERGGVFALRVRAREHLLLSLTTDLESRPWRTWSSAVPPRKQEILLEGETSLGSLDLSVEWKKLFSPYQEHKEKVIVRRALRGSLETEHGIALAFDLKDSASPAARGTLARLSISFQARRWKTRGVMAAAWMEPGAPALHAYAGSLPGEMRFMQASRSGHGCSLTFEVLELGPFDLGLYHDRSEFAARRVGYGVHLSGGI